MHQTDRRAKRSSDTGRTAEVLRHGSEHQTDERPRKPSPDQLTGAHYQTATSADCCTTTTPGSATAYRISRPPEALTRLPNREKREAARQTTASPRIIGQSRAHTKRKHSYFSDR